MFDYDWGMDMKEYDERELREDSHTLIHRILKKIRECERYNIDYDVYLNRVDFLIALDVLDCCLKNKDSKNIARKK